MSSRRKLKRNISESEDDDSKPDNSDAETEEFSHNKPAKKKKIWLDSGSESESSLLGRDAQNDDEKQSSASDEDEPLDKLVDMSKQKEKECKVYSSSNSSDDEILATKSKRSSSNPNAHKITSNHSFSHENRHEDTSDDDDDEPIGKIAGVSKLKRKPKVQNCSSDSSDDDEPLANKNKKAVKNLSEKHDQSLHFGSENDEHEKRSDKVDTVSLVVASRKSNGHDTSSCNSDDESDSKPEENKSEISSDEEPLSKIVKSSQTRENSKVDASASDSDDEPLVIKNKGSKQKTKSKVDKNQKPQSIGDGYNTSSEEEEPISEIAKDQGKSKKMHSSSNSSDDEPLSSKMAVKQKLKSQNGNLSSDEEEKPISNVSRTSKEKAKKEKDKNSSNAKIEHLKKYLRVAGIHINSYDKLFEGCKSIKSKTEKLLGLLHEKGLKGRPTIEKCKKLKKKIETKKEIAELDLSNIIKSEGRPKRGAGGKIIETVSNTQNSPAAKKFARLRDIIDSEDSD